MSSDNHNYDGIVELDNPLPNWWLAIFQATIIFAFIYSIHYMTGSGPTLSQEFESDMKSLPQVTEKVWTEEELIPPFNSADKIASGKAVFAGKCAACHGNEGQGVIGPNLADKYWIHGQGHRTEIIQVIKKGVIANGMPGWGDVLSESELVDVAAYAYSLRATNPANPKAPQGTEIK